MNKDNKLMMEELQKQAWKNFLLQAGSNPEQIEAILQNEGLEGIKKFGKELLKKTTPLAVGAAVMASSPEAEARGLEKKEKAEKPRMEKKTESKKSISPELEKQIEFVSIMLDYNNTQNKKETQAKLMGLFGLKDLEDLEGALREYALTSATAKDNVEYALSRNILN